jgi:hypothetical protein
VAFVFASKSNDSGLILDFMAFCLLAGVSLLLTLRDLPEEPQTRVSLLLTLRDLPEEPQKDLWEIVRNIIVLSRGFWTDAWNAESNATAHVNS